MDARGTATLKVGEDFQTKSSNRLDPSKRGRRSSSVLTMAPERRLRD